MNDSLFTKTRPREAYEIVAELHDELYLAIYRGDFQHATSLLDELAMIGPTKLQKRLHHAKRGWGKK